MRTAVHAGRTAWVPSPTKGVDRRMLFRVGEEKARATSIVRYAPGSQFPRHFHPGGEEFLVLEGVFQDEKGDYPTGSYIRNPPGSSHAPSSQRGCVIFVRLWQFRSDDDRHVARLADEVRRASTPNSDRTSSIELFRDPYEDVRIEDWQPGVALDRPNPHGLELLVISGSLTEGAETFERYSWLRLPSGEPLRARSGDAGCRVWMKANRLPQSEVVDF